MPVSAIRFFVRNRPYVADLTRPADLAIPVVFDGPQPSVYGAPPAAAEPFASGDFLGSVAGGGPVNAWRLRLIPHANGTHTESSAHVTADGAGVSSVSAPGLVPATLLTVAAPDEPAAAFDRMAVEKRLSHAEAGFLEAVVIRTAGRPKWNRDWDREPGPFFTPETIQILVRAGTRHLLVDVPSVDPLSDGGRLAAHRAFWDLEPGETRSRGSIRTITELISVPESLDDGPYLLDLQLPSLQTDAVPSRPVLFPVFRDLE